MRTCYAPLVLCLAGCGPAPETPYGTPDGFTVESALPEDSRLALGGLTFDSLGRPVVSLENGPPVTLLDQDRDGVFEAQQVFTDRLVGAQGLWFEGRTLYTVAREASGRKGLWRASDTDGDDVADQVELIHEFRAAEGATGLFDMRRGPDGAPTLLLADARVLRPEWIDPASPLRAPGGGLLARFNRELGRYTLLAGGLGKPFSHAYNLEGEGFTYRAGGSLHCIPGADYGWREAQGPLPGHYLDILPPMRELESGTPAGIEFYQHRVYPGAYRNVLFEADRALGRILWSRVVPNGGDYKPFGRVPTVFLRKEGLDITDLEVGPDGLLYFTVGDRLGAGGLFRVRYTPGFRERMSPAKEPEGIFAVLHQPQPLSSWGWAALETKQAEMGPAWGEDLARMALDDAADPTNRMLALLLLGRHGPKPSDQMLSGLSQDRRVQVRAAVAYLAGQRQGDIARRIASAGLQDAEPLVRRRSAEALVRMGLSPDKPGFAPADTLYGLLADSDRYVRYAGRLALERTPRYKWKDRALNEPNRVAAMEAMLALIHTATSPSHFEPVLDKQISLMQDPGLSAEDRLRLLRTFQLAASRSAGGLAAAMRGRLREALEDWRPASDKRLEREVVGALAWAR